MSVCVRSAGINTAVLYMGNSFNLSQPLLLSSDLLSVMVNTVHAYTTGMLVHTYLSTYIIALVQSTQYTMYFTLKHIGYVHKLT